MVRIRRLCGVLALLALALPFVPWTLGLPFRMGWGGHHGAPRYGNAECLSLSLALMLVAAVGTVATQSSLPRGATGDAAEGARDRVPVPDRPPAFYGSGAMTDLMRVRRLASLFAALGFVMPYATRLFDFPRVPGSCLGMRYGDSQCAAFALGSLALAGILAAWGAPGPGDAAKRPYWTKVAGVALVWVGLATSVRF